MAFDGEMGTPEVDAVGRRQRRRKVVSAQLSGRPAAAAEKRMGNDLGPASLQARTSFTPKDGVKISSAVMLPLDFFEMKEAKQKPSATAYEVPAQR